MEEMSCCEMFPVQRYLKSVYIFFRMRSTEKKNFMKKKVKSFKKYYEKHNRQWGQH